MTRRILLIEDDAISQDVIRSLLTGQGYQVDVASDGFTGLDRARAGCYEALLIDYHLPEMDGYALARLLRDEPAMAAAQPVLIGLTADRSGLAARRGADAVFKAILSKPIRPQDLFDAIERLCAPPSAVTGTTPAPVQAQVATAELWRRHGLAGRPKAFVSPAPTGEQETALALCFDLVPAQDAEIVLLLERHGIGEAVRACAGHRRKPPVIALSDDHRDISDAVFKVNEPSSWSALAGLLAPPPPLPEHAPVLLASDAPVVPMEPSPKSREMDRADRATDPAADLRPMIVHGVCSPLSALRNRLDGIARAAGEAPVRDLAADVSGSLREIGLSLDAVADFLREPPVADGEDTVFDPAELARNSALMIADTHPGAAAPVCTIDPTLPTLLRGDAHRIGQVLLTLLADAAERDAGGTIALQVGFSDDTKQLRFHLSLGGIDQAPMPTHSVLVRLRAMRLATLNRLVGLIGGRVGHEQIAGQGECYNFTVPARRESALAPGEPASVPARVLLVDPGAISGQILATLLSNAGHHICLVPDIAAALFACAGSRYDLAFVDLVPSQPDREQALTELARFREAAPAIPVVLLAPDGDPAQRDALSTLDIAGVLAKPCSKDGLLRAIERWAVRQVASTPGRAVSDACARPALDQAIHAALVEALGAATVASLARKFFVELGDLIDPVRLAADASLPKRLNGLAATAAMFGLSELADCCMGFGVGAGVELNAACARSRQAIAGAERALGVCSLAA